MDNDLKFRVLVAIDVEVPATSRHGQSIQSPIEEVLRAVNNLMDRGQPRSTEGHVIRSMISSVVQVRDPAVQDLGHHVLFGP
jgi:hypothetical protein